jgi:hypothetical protein
LIATGEAELLASKVSRGYAAPWSFDVLTWTGTRFRLDLTATELPALLRHPNAPSTHTTEENILGVHEGHEARCGAAR